MTVRRHALAIAACELIPVPFADTWAQNRVRRHLVADLAAAQGLSVDAAQLPVLADEAYAPVQRAATWPIRAIAKKVFFFVTPLLMVHEYRKAVAFGRRHQGDRPRRFESAKPGERIGT